MYEKINALISKQVIFCFNNKDYLKVKTTAATKEEAEKGKATTTPKQVSDNYFIHQLVEPAK